VALICKYCGRALRSVGTSLTSDFGTVCPPSPAKKHVALPNPPCCVYCGKETRSAGSQLTTTFGTACSSSPSGSHQLSD